MEFPEGQYNLFQTWKVTGLYIFVDKVKEYQGILVILYMYCSCPQSFAQKSENGDYRLIGLNDLVFQLWIQDL